MSDDTSGKGRRGRPDHQDGLGDHLADREFERAMRQLGVGQSRRQRQADDDALFEAMMGDAPQPRETAPRSSASGSPRSTPPRERRLAEDDALFAAAMEASGMAPVDDDGSDEPHVSTRPAADERVDGTPRTLKRRIKSGQFKAAPTLDLHGLRREAAREAVESFLRRAAEQGHATVRIIPGRGLHSRDGAVLQEALMQWLRVDFLARIREVVTAPMAQGGSGAVFVFLRPAGG